MIKRTCFMSMFLVALLPIIIHAEEKTKTKVAFVYRAAKIPFGDKLMEGFKAAVEDGGGECILRSPEEPTAEAQIKIVKELIKDGVVAIGISANSSPALETALAEARRGGIKVVSADLPAAPGSRDLHINPVDPEQIGRTLIRSAYDMMDGAGQLAILSSHSSSSNQNAWIGWMRRELSRARYKNIKLAKIAYGNDDSATAARQTELLLEEYPNLKIIVAPTTTGIAAAAKMLTGDKHQNKVLLTGLGFPSELAAYVDDGVCPWFFLWNPEDIGYLAGHAAVALVDGAITGMLGEYFIAGRLGTRSVVQAGDLGTEVRLGAPYKFDTDNINVWKNVY